MAIGPSRISQSFKEYNRQTLYSFSSPKGIKESNEAEVLKTRKALKNFTAHFSSSMIIESNLKNAIK